MLNYDLQVAILKSLEHTYTDEKRIDVSSNDHNVSVQDFYNNITYLKREKLIDLSSLSIRTNNDEAEKVEYALARATINHNGIKVLACLNATKIIINPYL